MTTDGDEVIRYLLPLITIKSLWTEIHHYGDHFDLLLDDTMIITNHPVTLPSITNHGGTILIGWWFMMVSPSMINEDY